MQCNVPHPSVLDRSSLLETGCFQPTHCRAVWSHRLPGTVLGWCGKLCSFQVTWREQSQRQDFLEASFLFVLTMCFQLKARDTLGWTSYFQFLLNICSPVKNTVWIPNRSKVKEKSTLRRRILNFLLQCPFPPYWSLKSLVISGLTLMFSILESHLQRNLSFQNLPWLYTWNQYNVVYQLYFSF